MRVPAITTHKADFDKAILKLSKEVKSDWWKKNKKSFLEETD